MIESQIFISTFFAIISAALPLGARMIGIWPTLVLRIKSPLVEQTGHAPIVAMTLNNPLAIHSISLSIWSSAEEAGVSPRWSRRRAVGMVSISLTWAMWGKRS